MTVINAVVVEVKGPRGKYRNVFPISKILCMLERIHFPGCDFPETVRNICGLIFMVKKQSVILVPAVRGIKTDFGSTLQTCGLYEIWPGTPVIYKNFEITVAFELVHSLRGIHDMEISAFRGDASVLWINNKRGRLLTPSWPSCSTISAFQFGVEHTDIPLWLPGPSDDEDEDGYDDVRLNEYLVNYFFAVQRRSTQSANTCVTRPYGPLELFRSVLRAIPPWINTIVFVVHTRQQVSWLDACIQEVAESEVRTITDCRVEFATPGPWEPDIRFGRGYLKELCFHGIEHPGVVPGILQLLRLNPDIDSVSFAGNSTLITKIVDYLASHEHNVGSWSLSLSDRNSPDSLLWSLKQISSSMFKIQVEFTAHPRWSLVKALLSKQKNTLTHITVKCKESDRRHFCSANCNELTVLPSRLPQIQEIRLDTLTCSSILIAQCNILGTEFKLSVKPSKWDFEVGADLFDTDIEHPQSVIQNLTLESVHNWLYFARNNSMLFASVKTLSILNVKLFEVDEALLMAKGVTELYMKIDMDRYHTGSIRNPYNGDHGIADHFFTGCLTPANGQDGCRIQDCKDIQRLTLIFSHSSFLDWNAPSLGLSFATNGLSHLPALEYFYSNEVSKNLRDYLIQRMEPGQRFFCDISVFKDESDFNRTNML